MALGRLGVLVSSSVKQRPCVKIRYHGKCKHLVQCCHWVNTQLQRNVIFCKRLIYVKLLGCMCFAAEETKEYLCKASVFWCCSIWAQPWLVTCLLSWLLKKWNLEETGCAENNLGRKILTQCAAYSVHLNSFKTCLIC